MYNAVLLLLPLSIGAEQPKVVEFGTPPVETQSGMDRGPFSGGVTEKSPTVPIKDYSDLLERVKVGEKLTFTTPLAGFPGESGTYDCWLGDRHPMMQRREGVSVVASPFLSGSSPVAWSTIPTTGATSAATSPTPALVPGSYAARSQANTPTFVPFAGTSGFMTIQNCPPSG